MAGGDSIEFSGYVPKPLTKKTRKKGPHVRSGCLACKERRKKCNERRPTCSGCSDRGYVCVYPLERQVIIHSDEQIAVTEGRPILPRAVMPPAMSDIDVQNFDYFRTVCTKQFSTYFDGKLWKVLVMQAASVEPSIRHAVLAIGALSRAWKGTPGVSKLSGPALAHNIGHYNKSMKLLRETLQGPTASWELALLACFLFIAIEVLQGNDIAVHLHHRHAFSILSSLPFAIESAAAKSPMSPWSKIPNNLSFRSSDGLDDLISAFSRLDVHAAPITNLNVPAYLRIPSLPAEFANIEASHESLNAIMSTMHSVTSHGGEHLRTLPNIPLVYQPTHHCIATHVAKVKELLSSWKTLTEALIERSPALDIKTQATVNILFIHHLVTSIKISTHFFRDQIAYDAYDTEFKRIITLGAAVVEADIAYLRSLRSGPCSMIDAGIVQPLYFVALRSRNPALRRQAIDVMEMVGEERVHDSQTLGKVTRWVIEHEEEDLELFVVEARRFHAVKLEFGEPNVKCRVLAKRRNASQEWEELVTDIL